MSLPLLHTPADVLRWAMVAIGLGSDPTTNPIGSWPIYVGKQPDSPDNVLTVYNTTPRSDGRDMGSGETFLHYGFQVRVRGSSDPVAGAKAEAVRKGLDQDLYLEAVTVGSAHYLIQCSSTSGVSFLGEDVPNSKRQVYVLNGVVTLKRLP